MSVVRGLLAAGADKDRASNDGYSPLTWARSCGGSGDTTPAVFVEYIRKILLCFFAIFVHIYIIEHI